MSLFLYLGKSHLLSDESATLSITHKIIRLDSSKKLRIESGDLARLADGCALVQQGDTTVMVTAVSRSRSSPAGSGFVPLTVDYRQKAAAAGRIPTNYLRRELGPTEHEILTSRVIDRSIRPLFPPGYFYDTQIICNLLAVDSSNDPDILAINGASAALSLSDIPWNGPIGAVRVGYINNKDVVINPTRREQQHSTVNLVIATNARKNVLMMEMSTSEPVGMNDLVKCISSGIKESYRICNNIDSLRKNCGKPKRQVDRYAVPSKEVFDAMRTMTENRLLDVFENHSHDKASRDAQFQLIRDEAIEKVKQSFPEEDSATINEAFTKVMKKLYREMVFRTGMRCDGRGLDDIRPLNCKVDLYKPLHGSALFQRGQTQVMCTVAFDSLDSMFKADPVSAILSGLKEKNFLLHYEFPPYAVNEIGRVSGQNRREMGHGALAEKAIRPLIPNDFPFTIRATCEVLESNGSSSMASVCAGSMALMDAGVGIDGHVAGVAMGLLYDPPSEPQLESQSQSPSAPKTDSELESESEPQSDSQSESQPQSSEDQIGDSSKRGNTNYRLLTDLLGLEDYLGEMDFKIAGTKKGFTALQLDCKLADGLSYQMTSEALVLAHKAKNTIIGTMNNAIPKPRADKKDNWPVTDSLRVEPQQRGAFLGFGGHNLKKIQMATGVHITSDVDQDPNLFSIFAPNQEAMSEAKEMIAKIIRESQKEPQLDFGSIYTAKIVEIRANGVMVILYPNMNPALLPLSQLDTRKVQHPEALGLEVGQDIQVKYFGRDPVTGAMRLSRKVLQTVVPRIKDYKP